MTIGFDFEGFGKSPGLRGYIHNLYHLVRDLCEFVEFVQERYGKDLPLFLIGVSMGGLVGLYAALLVKIFKGCIFLAPAFGDNHHYDKTIKKIT